MSSDADIADVDVLTELDAVLADKSLSKSPQLQAMLKYLVVETLAGRSSKIKAFNIAVDVFGRDASFDSAEDTIVRVQAGRLRAALASHYAGAGNSRPIRIELPKGTYVPTFTRKTVEPLDGSQIPHGDGTRQEFGHSNDQQPKEAEDVPGRREGRTGAYAVLLGLLLFALAAYFASGGSTLRGVGSRTGDAIAQQAEINALVLAPFQSVTGQAGELQLAAGLTAELATSLTHPGMVNLKPAPTGLPGSQDVVQAYAKAQKARWALTGILHQSEGRQRSNVYLMDVAADRIVWSQSYDVPLVEATSTRIADSILLDLRPALYTAAKSILEKKSNPTPSELFILANWSPGKEMNSLAWQQERIALARTAIAGDPNFGPAYSVLADKLSLLATIDPRFDTEAVWQEAAAAARQARLLSPHSSEASFNLALYHLHAGEMDDALRMSQRTLELSPRHTLARFWVSVVPYYCKPAPKNLLDELTVFDSRLSPSNPARWQTKIWLARLHLNNGSYSPAIEAAQQSYEIVPNLNAALILGAAFTKTGSADAARKIIAEQKQYWPGFKFEHYIDVTIRKQCEGSPILKDLQDLHRAVAASGL